jgi:hypothetical protein
MPRRQTTIIPFPRARTTGLVISAEDHAFLVRIIGPFYGSEVEDLLAAASTVPDGRRLSTRHPAMEQVLNAIGTEVHGFLKLEDEEAGRPRLKPKRGGTADHLLALYRQIESHLS